MFLISLCIHMFSKNVFTLIPFLHLSIHPFQVCVLKKGSDENVALCFFNEQYNDVADKRRPRTTMPLKKQLPIILEHLFNRTTLQSNNTRKNKANNCTNAKCENGVRLIGLLYL